MRNRTEKRLSGHRAADTTVVTPTTTSNNPRRFPVSQGSAMASTRLQGNSERAARIWRDRASQITKLSAEGQMGAEIARQTEVWAFRTSSGPPLPTRGTSSHRADPWETRFGAVHVKTSRARNGRVELHVRQLVTHANQHGDRVQPRFRSSSPA